MTRITDFSIYDPVFPPDDSVTFLRMADVMRVIDKECLEGFAYVLRVRGYLPGFNYERDWLQARRGASLALSRLAALEVTLRTAGVWALLNEGRTT